MNDDYCIENDFAAQRELYLREQAIGEDYATKQRIRADKAEAKLKRLKDAVRWERECRYTFAWLNNTLANVHADVEVLRSLIAARRAVEELL